MTDDQLDPRRLVRQGTSQATRSALGPLAAPPAVDERAPEHQMVFAAAYADLLAYVDGDGNPDGTWKAFFGSDPTLLLARAAVDDLDAIRATFKELTRAIELPAATPDEPGMVRALGQVFDCVATIATRLDELAVGLQPDQAPYATLSHLIATGLRPVLARLIGYRAAGVDLHVIDPSAPPPADLVVLGGPAVSFTSLLDVGLRAPEWTDGDSWNVFCTHSGHDPSPYGAGTTTPDHITALATHHLFAAACDTFLAGHARIVSEARAAMAADSAQTDHQPHYALFTAFLRLLEHPRAELNTLTGKHLDFYYREVLRLRERPAEPSHAHVLVELAKHVDQHLLGAGTLLRAGKADDGTDRSVATDRELVANRATVSGLMSLYRHPSGGPLPLDGGRLFADADVVADPDAPAPPFARLTRSWGEVTKVDMPRARVGFAVASHHLWLAEGTRTITVRFRTTTPAGPFTGLNLTARLTTAKGWHEIGVTHLDASGDTVALTLELDGGVPPITPYDATVHGLGLGTGLPVLAVELEHLNGTPWDYGRLEQVEIDQVTVAVAVSDLRTLALSNDQGPVDASKPFLPYGAAAGAGSSLVVGSREAFGKHLTSLSLHGECTTQPVANGTTPTIQAAYLSNGGWVPTGTPGSATGTTLDVTFGGGVAAVDEVPSFQPTEPFSTASRAGFVRLLLQGGFGTETYARDLATWLTSDPTTRATTPPAQPAPPTLASLTLSYDAVDTIDLAATATSTGRFFHLTPFGYAEVRAAAGLLPRFRVGDADTEGELLIGVADLAPPEQLSLLLQVADGTADPLVVKPPHHLQWSYLAGDRWQPFGTADVVDGTAGLLRSGVVTIAVPADASTEHTLLPAGRHWLRVAATSATGAVCRLRTVAAQAVSATETGSLAAGTTAVPAGTITKPVVPDAAVKSLAQPFGSFGGRPPETAASFATRVSERLRHRDRAIALWDYERLVLEAFPSLFQVRCLNHTRYEPTPDGVGIYQELAAGHVTVVPLPDLTLSPALDPLRPFTSLGLLDEVAGFLGPRIPPFATLHVRNPQFEQVVVDLRVRLRDGADESLCLTELRTEITRFLSPWAYGDPTTPTFDGSIHQSVLVDALEELAYVDYLTDVRLYRRLPGATSDGPALDEVTGSRAISILVSAPPERHRVQIIHEGA